MNPRSRRNSSGPGRCEFAGCNAPLWRSTVTQEAVNTAEKAHIYAFSLTLFVEERRVTDARIVMPSNGFRSVAEVDGR